MIGGNVATNAGGEYYSRYGSISSNLLGLTAVLPSGEVIDLHNTMKKSSSGFDLKNLFVGSEGTLGVITDVCMTLHPKPAGRAVAVLICNSMQEAADLEALARKSCGGDVGAVELMDNRILTLVRDRLSVKTPLDDGRYHVLVELLSHSEKLAESSMSAFLNDAFDKGVASDGCVAQSNTDMAAFWNAREACGPAVNSFPFKFKYDLSLPLDKWAELATATRARVTDSGATVVTWGHLGDRNVHLNIVWDEGASITKEEMKNLLEPFVYDFVIDNGGSISAEHGIGVAKSKYMERVKGRQAMELMRGVKAVFDENGIMNPGKML
jgi:FAD/FMN-containing dehydrogenase